MTREKFQADVLTLEKFFTKFCEDKHKNQYTKVYTLEYKQLSTKLNLNLCQNCHELISYSFDRLKECPHDIKPKCRKCPNPCYEKIEWKSLAKIMRYSGLRFGLSKIKKHLNLGNKTP